METPVLTATVSPSQTPPRLVKYLDERGLDVLFNRELKITPPREFNDPFEFWLSLPADLNRIKDELRKQLCLKDGFIRNTLQGMLSVKLQRNIADTEYEETMKKACSEPEKYRSEHEKFFKALRNGFFDAADQNFRLACFSKEPKDITSLKCEEIQQIQQGRMLMWSHYAMGHRGLVIEFDFTQQHSIKGWVLSESGDGNPFKVVYEPTPREICIREFNELNTRLFEILQRWAQGKSETWAYENEWRFIAKPDDSVSCWTTSRLVNGRLMDFMSLRAVEGKPATPYDEKEPIKAIRRVVIGCKAEPKFRADVRRVLDAPAYRHVHIQEAKLLRREYGLEYETIRPPAA
ncbi:MAG: DUF2971 domain-containing protein [Opitutaceae bacterium]|nr:DUF2971 domain-containing protein [Opitutaceae bacterium]